MSQDAKQEMLTAKSLIQAGQYQEAYDLLLTINHPKAQEWIDQIQPKLTIAEDDFEIPQKGKGIPDFKPWNPQFFMLFYLFGITGIITNFVLSLNWKRMGRPQWVVPSLIASVGLPLLAIGGMIAVIASGLATGVNDMTPVIVTFLAGSMIVFYVFSLSFHTTQSSAYKVWLTHGNRALLEHNYKLKNVFLKNILLSSLIMIGLVAFILYYTVPAEYESDFIRLEYQRTWDVENLSEIEDCSYEWLHCEIMLSESQYVYTGLQIMRVEFDFEITARQWLDDDIDYWESTLDNFEYSQDTYMIDGREALRLYSDYDMDGDRIASIDIYIIHNGYGLAISTWSGCGGCLREDLPKIMKVVDSIEFVD